MKLDMIEVQNKKYILKVVLIVIIAILFIIFFTVLGMNCAKKYKAKILANKKKYTSTTLNNNNINKENITQEPNKAENSNIDSEQNNSDSSEEKKPENTLLPVYSEKAKKQMKDIYKGNKKIAYLTFDDGPSQAVTPLILDLLKSENIKATFFVLGSCVDKNPELLQREYKEGHYIANHGYSHNYAKIYKTSSSVLDEYNKTEKSVQKALENPNYSSHLFRFPGGYYGGKYASIKKEAGKLLNKNNISYIDWNALTGDAEGANTKEKIIKNIKKYVKNNGPVVILMHDAAAKILTYETLKDVIDYLRSQGYIFDNFYSIMQ